MSINKTSAQCATAALVMLLLLTVFAPPTMAGGQDRINVLLTLNDVIDLALHNDRQLEIASLEVAVAARNADIARSALLPQVSASASKFWLKDSINIDIPEYDISFNTGTSFPISAGAQVAVPIYTGGSVPRYLSARRLEMSEKEAEERIRQTVRFNASKAYYAVLQAQHYLALMKDTVVRLEAHKKVATDFYNEGLVDKSDLLQAELQLADVKQQLFTVEKGYQLAVSNLNKTIGRDINAETTVVDVADTSVIDITLEKSTDIAIENRPELKQLQAKVEAALLASQAARESLLPSVAAVASVQRVDNELLEDDTIVYGGIQVNLDIFNGGKSYAEIGKASKQHLQASLALEDAKEGLELQVKDAWLALTESRKKLEVAEFAVTQAEENLRIVENKYAAQMASSTDVLDAQNFHTNAVNNYNQAKYEVGIANAQFYWALGITSLSNKEIESLTTMEREND